MLILQWSKTQIMCLLILIYIQTNYLREAKNLKKLTDKSKSSKAFIRTFLSAELAIFFDGVTACTVNYLDRIPSTINLCVHLAMFVTYQIFVMLIFYYWTTVTIDASKNKRTNPLYFVPGIILIILTIVYIPQLYYVQGKYTYYSLGTSVYISFVCVAIYCILTLFVVISNHRYIPKKKRISLATTLLFIAIVLTIQIIFPESLVSCIASMMVIISIYLTMENPATRGLEHYHHEMVMGFATLVENKDDNTGGHIRRSSAYAVLIAENLRTTKKYKNIITKDFIDNLAQSAPMHDIGKIGIPDAILQKPGKLTAEEYDIMKTHPVIGGKIIKDTFGHLYNGEYEDMAYQVASYHHEKWNGKGYPTGLKEQDIPLCARIMAVADVFDAVSAKRCYRDAMPLEECYNIILNGKGVDFDPDIVDAFMEDRDKIEKIYYSETSRRS